MLNFAVFIKACAGIALWMAELRGAQSKWWRIRATRWHAKSTKPDDMLRDVQPDDLVTRMRRSEGKR